MNRNPWPSDASYAMRWKATIAAAKQLATQWGMRAGVVSVGPGFIHAGRRQGTRRGSLQRVEFRGARDKRTVPGVIVVVERSHARSLVRAIPKVLVGKVRSRAGTKAVGIPVQTVVDLPSRLHGDDDGDWGCSERGQKHLLGTITAFVTKGKHGDKLLLSAAHFLGETEYYRPDPGQTPFVSVYRGDELIGGLSELADAAVDAALATCGVQPQLAFTDDDGRSVRLKRFLERGEHLPQNVIALTRRGPQHATVHCTRAHSALYYTKEADPQWITRSDVLWSIADDGSSFAPGDSGAALVTEDGVLVAMHYAGTDDPDRERDAPGIDSYAIMAYDLVAAFDPPLELA